jgi:hypothetical protein
VVRVAAAVGLTGVMALLGVDVPSRDTQIRDLIHGGGEAHTWHIEHDPTSSATMAVDGSTLTLRFAIGAGRAFDQFVAMVKPFNDGVTAWDRLTFRASADRPLRLAVQLRAAGNRNPPLWRRSVYLDASPRVITIFFRDMRPVAADGGAVPLNAIGALLIGLDTVNTKPGTTGTVSFSEIALER